MKRLVKRTTALLLAVLTLASGCLLLTACSGDEPSVPAGATTEPVNTTPPKKKIAFTFDDGPQAPAEDLEEGYYPYTTYILDKLEEIGGKATFFVLGTRAMSYPAALNRAISLGCEVGCHSYDHENSFRGADNDTIKSDLDKTSAAITGAGAPAPKLFRPVGGSITEDQLKYIASLGYSTIGWSIDTLDYDGRPKTGDKFADDPERNAKYESFVNEKVEYIMQNARDGAIVLMHDIYMSSADIFIAAADRLIAEGYELVTVSELLGLSAETPVEPVMYISKNDTITYMP